MRTHRRRWLLAWLMFAGIAINYIDRVNISHAIIVMRSDLGLSPVQEGVLLSAFSWGYVAFMLFGGILVDRSGPVVAAGGAATVWSVSTVVTGMSPTPTTLILSRLGVGAGEAPIFPANARIVREQFPSDQRGLATAVFDSGSYVGTAFAAPLVVGLILSVGWRASFGICGALGMLWVATWFWATRRLISPIPAAPPETHSAAVIKELLKTRKIAGIGVGFFCYNYAKNFFLTWFPTYLVVERGFTLLKVGYLGMLPPLAAVITEWVAGWSTDRMIRHGYSTTIARKLPLCFGLLLSGTVVLANFTNSPAVVLLLFTISFAATISASPSIWAIPGDIAPSEEHVGTIGGIQNTYSNVAGIVAPIATGFIFERTGTFAPALLLSTLIAWTGAAVYWFMVGELVPIRLSTKA